MRFFCLLLMALLSVLVMTPAPADACNNVGVGVPVVAARASFFSAVPAFGFQSFASPVIPAAAVPVQASFAAVQPAFAFQAQPQAFAAVQPTFASVQFAAVPSFAFAATPFVAVNNVAVVHGHRAFAVRRGAFASVVQRRGLFADVTVTRVRR